MWLLFWDKTLPVAAEWDPPPEDQWGFIPDWAPKIWSFEIQLHVWIKHRSAAPPVRHEAHIHMGWMQVSDRSLGNSKRECWLFWEGFPEHRSHELPSLGKRVGLCKFYPCPSLGLNFSEQHSTPQCRLELFTPRFSPVLSPDAFFTRQVWLSARAAAGCTPRRPA